MQLSKFISQIIQDSVLWIKTQNKIVVLFTLLIYIYLIGIRIYNIFNYPFVEEDEGTYMLQAWSIKETDKIAYYTYWYDHSPMGWMVIAFFSIFLGGITGLGNPINTGRVIILIMHIISLIVIHRSVLNLTDGNKIAGLSALLFFGATNIGLFYQRRILLDNILIFFLALSFYILTLKKQKLEWAAVAGFLFGIGVLSKESGIFFLPAFVIYFLLRLKGRFRILYFFIFNSIVGSLLFLYLMLAVLKNRIVTK